MRLLAFGDLHLGAGTGLGREPGDRLKDQDAVLDRIYELALEHRVDAILNAGDTFEGPVVTPEQLDCFALFVAACDCAEIPVITLLGNGRHDAAVRPVNGVDIFRYIPGIKVYSRPGLYELPGGTVACLPWVSPARLVASSDGDVDRDRVNARAAELLVQVADGLADPRIKGTVLMLHGSISGASLPTGISTDDLREPVLPLEELLGLGFSAIVASHIHQPQIVTPQAGWTPPTTADIREPWLAHAGFTLGLYTGSPLPLNFGEVNVPHGVWILDVDGDGASAEFVPIESRRLVGLEVNGLALSTAGPRPDLCYDAEADGVDGAIVKVRVTGTRTELRHCDLAALRADLLDAGAHTVKIETETIREDRARVAGVTEDLEPLDSFDAWTAANDLDPGLAAAAREQMHADLEAVAA